MNHGVGQQTAFSDDREFYYTPNSKQKKEDQNFAIELEGLMVFVWL